MAITTAGWKYLEQLRGKVFDYEFWGRMKENPKDFTRVRRLGFKDVTLLVLNSSKRSNALETYDFMRDVTNKEPVTQEAFNQARRKISYKAFKEFFEDSSAAALEEKDCLLFHGYRVIAIDGSLVLLPKSQELVDRFGKTTPCKGKIYARVSLAADVLNGFLIDGEISGHDTGERKLAKRHIEKDLCEKALYLFDRGYWNSEIAASLINKDRKFMMRIQSNHLSDVFGVDKRSGYFDFHYKEYGIKTQLRFFKFELDSGEMEYLVTNLPEETVPNNELHSLYHLRWGVETRYNELKNLFKIEHFSGKSRQIILQDFYATLTIMNVTAFMILAANFKAKQKRKGKHNKLEYTVNKTFAVGVMRNRFVRILLIDDPVRRVENLDLLISDISKAVSAVRPGRAVSRHNCINKIHKRHPIKNAT